MQGAAAWFLGMFGVSAALVLQAAEPAIEGERVELDAPLPRGAARGESIETASETEPGHPTFSSDAEARDSAEAGASASDGADPKGGPVRYDAGFFARFSPRTALDMVRVVPSFSLREVEEERRGYSGAVGNVLIDGERPSAKSQTLEDILQRIPAAQVRWIEVLRGAEAGADASGDAVLVNVVRTPSAGAGVWSAGFEYAQQHVPAPNGFLAWTGRIGKLDYGLGFNSYSLKREQHGTRRTEDAAGELTELRHEFSPREFAEYAFNGECSRDLLGGRFRVTGQAAFSEYRQANTAASHAADGTFTGDQLLPYWERKRTAELGTTFDTAIAAWDWTIATILTRSRFDSDSEVTNRNALLAVDSEFQQLQRRDSGEFIARTTLARPLASAQRLEMGIEGALNTVDTDLDLTGTFGGTTVPIDVENANVDVEEHRGEAFITHAWKGARWSTEARLAGEASRLDFSGDAVQQVELFYLKPSLQLSRPFGKQHQFRVRAYRDVEQLDFNDFTSAVSLSDEIVEGGNPDLKPGTSWRLEAALDLRLGERTALSTRVFHHWLDDVVDLVPLGEAADPGPGNIGSGKLDGVQVTFATPLAPLIPGGTLNVDAKLQRAVTTDPITGRERPISGFERNKIKLEFRQDTRFHGLAWGIKYTRISSTTDYRVEDTDRQRDSPLLDIFVERNVFGGLKLRLSAASVTGSPELRRRAFYEADRNGPLLEVEDTETRPGRWLVITLSGQL